MLGSWLFLIFLDYYGLCCDDPPSIKINHAVHTPLTSLEQILRIRDTFLGLSIHSANLTSKALASRASHISSCIPFSHTHVNFEKYWEVPYVWKPFFKTVTLHKEREVGEDLEPWISEARE